MNENQNRRKDDARPAVALQWGDRPDHWTLLLTGPTAGVIGPLGSTWPNHPAELERVDVCVRRKDGPAVVYRTGGEGATTWHQFYPCSSAEPLRDGEYLYREGAVPKLDSIEQYRLQMAAIGTAAIGYWKLGDSIHPDYDTVPLRDVAALHARYDELSKFRESVRGMVQLLKNREWAEDLAATGDAAELQSVITELVGGAQSLDQDAERAAVEAWANENQTRGPSLDDVWCIYLHGKDAGRRATYQAKGEPPFTLREIISAMILEHDAGGITMATMRDARAVVAAPDAVDAALSDAIQHGTGAFTVKADGSTEHVDLRPAFEVPPGIRPPGVELTEEQRRYYAELATFPPKLQRDALYQDYAVPAKPADDGGKPE